MPANDFVQRLRMNNIFPSGGDNPFGAPEIGGGGVDINNILNSVMSFRNNQRQQDQQREDSLYYRQKNDRLAEIARQSALSNQAKMADPLRAQGGMNVVLGGGQKPGLLNGETLDQAAANRFDPYFGTGGAGTENYISKQTPQEQLQDKLQLGEQTIEGNKQVATATAKAAAATQMLKDTKSEERAAKRQENEVSNINLRDKNAQNMVDVKEKSDLEKKAVLADIDKKNKQEQVRLQAENTLKALDEILDPKTGSLTAGARQAVGTSRVFRGGMFGFAPGSEARTANAKIKTFTSQTVLNLIGELKAQSKTGGNPLGGNMSDKDLAFLESAANSLDPYGDEDKYEEQLRKIKSVLVKASQPVVNKTRSDGSPVNNDPAGIR